MRAALLAAAVALGAAAPPPDAPPAWPDRFATRVEALAILQTLNADLLSHPSATLTLDRWCAAHHLAPAGSRIVAQLQRDVDKPAGPEQRKLLGVSDAEPVRYRRVRLVCGERVLSEADNWYVPSRLTPEMNRLLDDTDTAFGRAVQALDFHRETLSAGLVWQPLPPGWEVAPPPPDAGGALVVPPQVIQHRAVLYTKAQVPFSEVVETYTAAVLDFPLTPGAAAPR